MKWLHCHPRGNQAPLGTDEHAENDFGGPVPYACANVYVPPTRLPICGPARLEYHLAEIHEAAAASEKARSNPGKATPASDTSNPSKCPWCSSTKHTGGKSGCPFGSAAIKRAAATRLAARAETRGGSFAVAAKAVLAEHLVEKEKEEEKKKEQEQSSRAD